MVQAFSLNIGLMRFFRRIKPTYKFLNAVCANTRSPSFAAFKFRYTQKTASFVAFMSTFLILNVFCRRNISKITKRIVARVSVNVINITNRPFTCHVKPCQSARPISYIVDADNRIAFRLHIPRNCARNYFSACFNAPSKNTSFGVVKQKFKQFFVAKLVFFHALILP